MNKDKTSTPPKPKASKKSPNVLLKTNQVPPAPAKPVRQISMNSTQTANIGQTFLHQHQGMPVIGSNLWHGSSKARSTRNGLVVSGCERLASVTTVTGNVPGTMMNKIAINPKTFGVRLPLIAEQYDKFVFRRATLHYVPSITLVNSAANGVIYMVASYDPNEPIPADLDSLASWAQNKTIFPVYERGLLDLDLRLAMQDPLFVDSIGDQRFGVQATVALVAGDAQTTTTPVGQWFIDYEVELSSTVTNIAETSSFVSVRYLNVPNGVGGPSLNALAVNYSGDPDIITLPPNGSTASYIMAPGYYTVHVVARSTVPITSGVNPRLDITGVSNVTATPLIYSLATADPSGTMANAIAQLANPAVSAFAGTNVADAVDSIYYRAYVVSTGANGTPSSIRLSLAASATTPAIPNWMIDVMFVRNPTSSYNISGNSNIPGPRPLPNNVLKVRMSQALSCYVVDNELAPFIVEARAFVRNHDASDGPLAAVLNSCFGLGETVVITTAPMFAHTAAEFALMLLKKFGPTVAAHLLGMAKDRLEKWLEKRE